MKSHRARRIGLEAVIADEPEVVPPAGEVVGPAGGGVVDTVAGEEPFCGGGGGGDGGPRRAVPACRYKGVAEGVVVVAFVFAAGEVG